MRLRCLGAVAILFGGLVPLGGVAPAACAAEGPHAALVVDTEAPGGQSSYCVSLPDDSVTGIQLIQLASEQHGLQYRLGYGGNVVCQLAGVGYSSDECLKDGPEFWGYWRGDGSGGWEWSSSGAQATIVRSGDVEGWSWGTGNDGSTHPAPPGTTFISVCGKPTSRDEPAARDPKNKSDRARDGGKELRGDKGDGRRTHTKVAASEEAPEGAEDREKRRRRGDDGRRDRKRPSRKQRPATAPTLRPSPSASESFVSSIPSDPVSSEDGPPVGGLLAGVATIGFVATGVVLQRRRMRSR